MLLAALVRRRIRGVFDDVSAGRHDRILSGVSHDVRHSFAGHHALGGTRVGREPLGRWFARLGRLFPGLDFDVHDITVSGWPWTITAVAQWTADIRPAAGPNYQNRGCHVIVICKGRVASITAYEDTEEVSRACRLMLEAGYDEAGAAPVV